MHAHTNETKLTIYTDGGCHGNPGPGGWAFVLSGQQVRTERYGSARETTNNRMELMAVIQALELVEQIASAETPVEVYTDSQYVRNGITQWIHTWVRNGWRTASKKPVKNQDLWQTLHDVVNRLSVNWNWVKGHAGYEQNERCDALVQQAISEIED